MTKTKESSIIKISKYKIYWEWFFVKKDLLKKIEGILQEYLHLNNFEAEITGNSLNFSNKELSYKIEINENKK